MHFAIFSSTEEMAPLICQANNIFLNLGSAHTCQEKECQNCHIIVARCEIRATTVFHEDLCLYFSFLEGIICFFTFSKDILLLSVIIFSVE